MKKTLYAVILTVFSLVFHAQVGINTADPQATFDVTGQAKDTKKVDGIIAPRLAGNQLKAKDALYGTNQIGAIVYATSAASPNSTKTINVTGPGYYYFDGLVWVSFKGNTAGDATRYLGGTVYSRFQQQSGGSLINSKVIGGNQNIGYNVGTVSETSSKGGIDSLIGNGYTISNPSKGIFDIKFDIPLKQIYGISVNIVDSYGYNNGNQTSTGTPVGTTSRTTEPGMRLLTNDNSQVSYISNSIIRIKTGDSNGNLNNRSFTFMVTGQ
ncbi:hypothetical protein SAMN05421664_2426 [Chryseobacterium soldanellicola]|uniref:C1q domain-containing protein n=1 Tax=Chryseobacterium soldanellicola TaxID=311333 RepID=A0A1H1DE63_9FLAO|nr:hypothetical protein [Chryseobacterium soldanellicola]SDQ74539.1 hypothetical protein SAMN05421664_2426 [Chryseobacterium soldanellicola]